jgi:hypothetical protein
VEVGGDIIAYLYTNAGKEAVDDVMAAQKATGDFKWWPASNDWVF